MFCFSAIIIAAVLARTKSLSHPAAAIKSLSPRSYQPSHILSLFLVLYQFPLLFYLSLFILTAFGSFYASFHNGDYRD